MSDGKVVIDVTLDDKTVRSDASKIDTLLKAIGATVGDKMDQQFGKNADKVTKSAQNMHQKVKDATSKPVEQTVKAKDETNPILDKVKKNTNSIPKSHTTTIKAKDEASAQLHGIRLAAQKTSDAYDHMKGVFAGTIVASGVTKAVSALKNGFVSMIQTGIQYNAVQDKMNAVWETLTGSAAKGQKMVQSINSMSTAFGQSTDLVNELDQQFYHVFDNQPRTEKLTKSVLTLADTLGMSSADVERLGLNFTHMLSSGRMQLGDFNMITDQLPMYGKQLLEYEQKIQHNAHLTMAQLQAEMSAGKISSRDAEAVLEQLGVKYQKATDNMMGTTQGLWRSIQSSWGRLTGQFVRPIFNLKKSGFKDLEDWLKSSAADRYFNHLGQVTADFIGKLTDLIQFLAQHKTAVLDFAKAFGVLAGSIFALRTVASIMSAFDTVMGGLKRLRSEFSLTAASAGDLAGAEQAAASAGEGIGGAVPTKGAKEAGGALAAGETVVADASKGSKWLSRLGSFTKLAGSTIAVMDVLSSFTNLFGMTQKTIGSHVGAAAGSLGGTWGGAAGGAAIGTMIAPGVGTAIGAGVGAAAGSYAGQEFGKAFGGYIQKNASNLGKPLINTSINWGKSIGKSTQSALNQYVKLSDTAQKQLENLVVSGQKVSKQNVGTLVKPYQQMASQIVRNFNKTKSGAANALAGLRKTNKTEYDQILKETTKSTNDKEKAVNGIEKQIEKIYNNAAKQHRSLTANEQSQINKLQDKMNKYAVQSMTSSANQQTIILGKLRDHASSLSAQQAAAIVKNAKKQEQGAISSADNEYKQVVKRANQKFNGVKSWADNQYYVNHSISKKQYEDIVNNATHERDGVISRAKQQHDQSVSKAQDTFNTTVSYAKRQAKGHVDQVNWETGNVLSRWSQMVNKIKGWWQSIVGFFTGKGDIATKAYAYGTVGHPGGPALVGDGTGSNAGPEAIIEPNGRLSFSPAHPTLVNLPRGTSVISAAATRRLFGEVPHYADGILSNAFNWLMKGPKYLVTKSFETLGLNNQAASIPGQFSKPAGDMVRQTTSLAINWAKSQANDWIGGLLALPSHVSGTLKNWIAQAVSIAHIPFSWASGLASIAMHESGGNPNAVNRWDINAKNGHPSMGLMQMIGSTFLANAMPGFGNILNPVDSIISSYNYIRKRYGNILNVPGIKAMAHGGGYVGYANGTDDSVPGQVVVAENEPEVTTTKDGRIMLANRPTSFDDFMSGSRVTPLSKIPKYASGLMSVDLPKINVPIFSMSGSSGTGGNGNVTVKVEPMPVTINSILDGKIISQTVTKIQNSQKIDLNKAWGIPL